MKSLIGLIVIIFSTNVYADALPKPWYQTNLQQYQAGTDLIDELQGERFGYLKSKVINASSGSVLQNISPPDEWLGRRMKLTALIKTNLIKGSANMFMRIEHGYGYKTFDYKRNNRIKGDTDWQSYSIVLDVPHEANTDILFGISLQGQGEVFFDDFKFEEVDYDVEVTGETKERSRKPTPSNLSFEYGQ